jgi:hypothetical protein
MQAVFEEDQRNLDEDKGFFSNSLNQSLQEVGPQRKKKIEEIRETTEQEEAEVSFISQLTFLLFAPPTRRCSYGQTVHFVLLQFVDSVMSYEDAALCAVEKSPLSTTHHVLDPFDFSSQKPAHPLQDSSLNTGPTSIAVSSPFSKRPCTVHCTLQA